MAGIRAGSLRHRVTLQAPVITQDAFGAPVKTWQNVANLWAMVESLSGAELIAARQVFAEALYKVTIRYYPGITDQHRIVYDGMNMDITNVSDVETRHITMELNCIVRVDQP